MAPLGWFGTIAFFGPFGIIFLLLITFPRFWFSLWCEKISGKKATVGEVMIYSFIGFILQFLLAMAIFL